MVIKKYNNEFVDVFTGNGWLNWSRFHIMFDKGRMSLKLIKGRPMQKDDFKYLYQELNK